MSANNIVMAAGAGQYMVHGTAHAEAAHARKHEREELAVAR
jgi:hypothetical protein